MNQLNQICVNCNRLLNFWGYKVKDGSGIYCKSCFKQLFGLNIGDKVYFNELKGGLRD